MEGVQRHQSCILKRLFKESAVWGDVGKSVKGSVGVEVGGVKNVRWNKVSPDMKLYKHR